MPVRCRRDPGEMDPSEMDPVEMDPSKIDPSKMDPRKMDPKGISSCETLLDSSRFWNIKLFIEGNTVTLLSFEYFGRKYYSKCRFCKFLMKFDSFLKKIKVFS